MNSMQLSIAIEHFDAADLIMSTTAYYLGRTSANVDDHCDRLVKAWPLLPTTAQDWIRRIVDEAFTRDDRTRAIRMREDSVLPLGHDCDRASWEKVRRLWREGN